MTLAAPDFLPGGGEMGAAIRAFDWAATPAGAARRLARRPSDLPAHHAGLAPAHVGVVGPRADQFLQ